ncbi:serine-type endopeptidase [Aureococcus anophagefferens]|nr:serine-type endopeptidase [Aureococcus anophagefferens]
MLPTYGRRLGVPLRGGPPVVRALAAGVCATCAGEDWNGAFGAACHTAIAEHCEYHFADDEDVRAFDHLYTLRRLPDRRPAGVRRARGRRARGRGGRGVIYVWATGNGYRYAGAYQQLEHLNNRFAITVGAVGRSLRKASYSEGGAATFVVAPGGDDDHVHGMVGAVAAGACGSIPPGTSFAAPLVAGVAALVLEANPRLGWRDVQGVLASTSRRVDLGSDDSWTTNLAGVSHSYKYGFGLVDALAAARAARRWTNWPEERKLEATNVAAETIFDYDGTERWVESEIAFSEKNVAVESVNVFVTIDHPHRGELWIELERGGVTSILTDDTYNFGNRYEDWKFLTLRHWGEPLDAGPFTLRVADRRRGTTDGSSYPERCKKRKSSCRWRREACRSRNECAPLRKSCKANGTSCKWKRKAKKCKAR